MYVRGREKSECVQEVYLCGNANKLQTGSEHCENLQILLQPKSNP